MERQKGAGEFQQINQHSWNGELGLRCDWGGSSRVERSGLARLQLEINPQISVA